MSTDYTPKRMSEEELVRMMLAARKEQERNDSIMRILGSVTPSAARSRPDYMDALSLKREQEMSDCLDTLFEFPLSDFIGDMSMERFIADRPQGTLNKVFDREGIMRETFGIEMAETVFSLSTRQDSVGEKSRCLASVMERRDFLKLLRRRLYEDQDVQPLVDFLGLSEDEWYGLLTSALSEDDDSRAETILSLHDFPQESKDRCVSMLLPRNREKLRLFPEKLEDDLVVKLSLSHVADQDVLALLLERANDTGVFAPALMQSARYALHGSLTFLLSSGVSTPDGMLPVLLMCAAVGNMEGMKTLVRSGADVSPLLDGVFRETMLACDAPNAPEMLSFLESSNLSRQGARSVVIRHEGGGL